jgi:hypothetical protein
VPNLIWAERRPVRLAPGHPAEGDEPEMTSRDSTAPDERTRNSGASRAIAVAALVFGTAWIAWRAARSLDGVPFWSGAALLAVEIGGLLATALLTWAFWPRQQSADASIGATFDPDVEVLVRCAGHDLERVRATLLASRRLGPVVVVDVKGDADVARLALDAGATYVSPDPDDLDGVVHVARQSTAEALFLLEAGDVPHPEALRRLRPLMIADVAAVQAPVTSLTSESAEHGAGGRHDHDVERRALVPALGARGVAPISGRGALLRRSAVVTVMDERETTDASPVMARAELTLSLMSAGWRIVAPGGEPLVAAGALDDPSELEEQRAAQASAARRLLVGPGGALRRGALRPTQRLSLAAQSVRPLAGVRRSVVVAVLIGSLLSGTVPFTASVPVLGLLWAPWFVLSGTGLWLLSGGTLVPGDRLRSSMRLLGASWRGITDPSGSSSAPGHVLAGVFGLQHGFASAAAVAGISVVIGLRALSDRVSHTLAPMTLDHTIVILAAGLWLLAGGLDALRLLARRAQARRATRVVSSLPSTFAERAALVVDLTPHGAGVVVDSELEVGAHEALELVVPTTSGCVSATLPVVVRNVRPDLGGERRVGVEFEAVEAHVADALAEFCVVQPGLDVLGADRAEPAGVPTKALVVSDDRPLAPRRLGLRAAALVAVVGAVATVAPSQQAEASGGGRVGGAVTVDDVTDDLTGDDDRAEPATGSLITVVCATDAGADGEFGTSDDTYTAPVSDTVGPDGAYTFDISGAACWRTVAPAVGFMVRAESSTLESPMTPQVVDLGVAESDAVELVPVQGAPEDVTLAGDGVVDDVVWADLDGDRIIDADEERLPGVTVSLLDLSGTVVGTVVTDTDGIYHFDGLADGQYRLVVSNLPTGYLATDTFGRTTLFPVAAGTDIDLSLGLHPAALITAEELVGAALASPSQLLAPPPPTSLRGGGPDRSPVGLGLALVVLASLLGASVVLGSVRPQRLLGSGLRFA